jgi:hypothetical protein
VYCTYCQAMNLTSGLRSIEEEVFRSDSSVLQYAAMIVTGGLRSICSGGQVTFKK